MSRWGKLITTIGYEILGGGSDKNVLKLDYGCTTLNMLKNIELYALKWVNLRYINCISIKLLKIKTKFDFFYLAVAC